MVMYGFWECICRCYLMTDIQPATQSCRDINEIGASQADGLETLRLTLDWGQLRESWPLSPQKPHVRSAYFLLASADTLIVRPCRETLSCCSVSCRNIKPPSECTSHPSTCSDCPVAAGGLCNPPNNNTICHTVFPCRIGMLWPSIAIASSPPR